MANNPEKNAGNMTNARLVSLLLDASGGDSHAFELLAAEYAPLLDAAVAAYAGKLQEQDLEELRQEALLAFFRAIHRYDPLYGNVSFGLYAKVCVRNGVTSAVRSLLASGSRSTLPMEACEADILPDPQDEIIEKEKADELRAMIRSLLSDYENTVWWAFYSGVPVKTIAAQLGKSVRSVENALSRIRRKLRDALS